MTRYTSQFRQKGESQGSDILQFNYTYFRVPLNVPKRNPRRANAVFMLFTPVCYSANPEHNLSDNSLDLSIPLVHETDTTITG